MALPLREATEDKPAGTGNNCPLPVCPSECQIGAPPSSTPWKTGGLKCAVTGSLAGSLFLSPSSLTLVSIFLYEVAYSSRRDLDSFSLTLIHSVCHHCDTFLGTHPGICFCSLSAGHSTRTGLLGLAGSAELPKLPSFSPSLFNQVLLGPLGMLDPQGSVLDSSVASFWSCTVRLTKNPCAQQACPSSGLATACCSWKGKRRLTTRTLVGADQPTKPPARG